jgi:methylase of polypeptide subunit release factors
MLADPPWVRSDGTDEFPDDPVGAIDGGDDGLDLARTCLHVIGEHLVRSGVAILQLGDRDQAQAVADHLERHPDIGLRVADLRNPDANGVLVLLTTE